MKKLMVALSLAALTFVAAAETYTWTGGETTSGTAGDKNGGCAQRGCAKNEGTAIGVHFLVSLFLR